MRFKFVRTLLVLALLGNIIIWHRIWRLFATQNTFRLLTPSMVTPDPPHKLHRRLARLVTVVIRQFETFENDVTATVESVLHFYPTIPILIVCNELPYPPLELDFANESMENVKLVNLQPEFNRSYDERNPLFYVRTKYVLFLPDGSRLSSKQVVQVRNFIYFYRYVCTCYMSRILFRKETIMFKTPFSKHLLFLLQETLSQVAKLGIVTVPLGRVTLNCIRIDLKVKEWTLRFSHIMGNECDAVSGKHATMVETRLLRKLTDPFLLPFTDALYIQTTAIGAKVQLIN